MRSTIIEVASDQISFIEKPVLVSGMMIKIDSSYSEGYHNAEATHYAFQMRDDRFNFAYFYMKRGEKANELRKALLANGGELKGSVTFTILKDRYSKGPSLIADLIDYEILSAR